MGSKKYCKQILKGDLSGIELNFDDFGMPCAAAANFFVGGVFCATASIARYDGLNAAQFIKHRLRAPKTTAAKDSDRRLRIVHRFPPNALTRSDVPNIKSSCHYSWSWA